MLVCLVLAILKVRQQVTPAQIVFVTLDTRVRTAARVRNVLSTRSNQLLAHRHVKIVIQTRSHRLRQQWKQLANATLVTKGLMAVHARLV